MADDFIRRSFLIRQLENFDEQVLSKKYNKSEGTTVETHTHDNKSTIDKLSETEDGVLLFDGNEIKGGSGEIGADGKSAYEVAQDNGFEGTEEEWLESLKGEKGKDGEDGKSISSIAKDESNNLIVTFTDGTTQDIGQLNVDISADFLTESGFGNIRYYNNTFQAYDNETDTWNDIEATSDNKLVAMVTPQPMQMMYVGYDKTLNKIKLKFKEPNDTIIDGQLLCIIEGVKIVRKKESEPENIDDGELILDLKRKDFGKYIKNYFYDNGIEPVIGDIYYYKFFPYSTTGAYSNLSTDCRSKLIADYEVYGFIINQNESDPASMITYIEDNGDYEPTYMDFENDRFNYGDWANAFFVKGIRPCMLKYDGTVDYYLNPNDYSLKEDGTASDYNNLEYEGNVMIELPKVYYKVTPLDDDQNEVEFLFSNFKIDDNFVCWSHIDANGNETDYCYIAAYKGYSDGTRLRSICINNIYYSNTQSNHTALVDSYNNTDYNMEVWCDRVLITYLLMLIGKSMDVYSIFGNTVKKTASCSGKTYNKGLFYGTTGTSYYLKVFGSEIFYGHTGIILGWIGQNSIPYVKMTYGQSDGSTVDGYSEVYSDYITPDVSKSVSMASFTYSGYCNYIKKMSYSNYGFFISSLNASSSTYYKSLIYRHVDKQAMYGYAVNDTAKLGVFCVYMTNVTAQDNACSSLSYKPLTGGGSNDMV